MRDGFFLKQRIYCLIGCLLGSLMMGGVWTTRLQAQQDEKQLYQLARQAMKDEIYSLAEIKIKALLEHHPNSTYEREVRVWLGHSQHLLGKHSEAIETLKIVLSKDSDRWVEEALFWQAESLSELNRLEEAETSYRRLLQQFPSSSWSSRARLGLGWVLLKENRVEQGNKVLQELMEKGDRDIKQLAAITQARWLMSKEQWQEAGEILANVLPAISNPMIKLEGELWMGELYLNQGDTTNALRQFDLIVNSQPLSKSLLMRAWLKRGEAAMSLKDWETAQSSFQKVLVEASDETLQLIAVRKSIEAVRNTDQLQDGLLQLSRIFQQANTTNNGAAACLMIIGEAQVAADQLAAASETWNGIVKNFPGTSWQGVALQQLAGLELQRKNTNTAIQLLEQIIVQQPQSSLAGEALFRIGEIFYKQERYEEATKTFMGLLTNATAMALKEKAYFNALQSLAKQNKLSEFNALQSKFTAAYPQSLLREQILYEQAQLYAKMGQETKAREQWTALLKAYPRSLLQPEVLFSIGKSFYSEGKYEDALAQFDKLTQDFTNNPVFASAEFWRLNTRAILKKDSNEQFLNGLEVLFRRSPASDLTPKILFKMGEIYFEEEDFANAQDHFVRFANQFAIDEVADQALYFAGQAALRREDFLAAIELFERLIREYPQSSRVSMARIAEGHVLRLQGKIKEALAIYERVLQQPLNPVETAMSQIGLGDCYYTLAVNDEKLYHHALKAYETVMIGEKARVDLLNEAGWKKGRTLEKLNRLDNALEAYMDVVYQRFLNTNGGRSTVPEYFWFGKAVSSAGGMLERQKNWKDALAVYKLAENVSGPDVATWHERRLRLQREHFIYE